MNARRDIGRDTSLGSQSVDGADDWRAQRVQGRALTTYDDVGIGGTTVVLQRRPAGAPWFRATDVTAVTGPLGRFTLSFLPRRSVEYRVALVRQPGLGGSAATLPAAT